MVAVEAQLLEDKIHLAHVGKIREGKTGKQTLPTVHVVTGREGRRCTEQGKAAEN